MRFGNVRACLALSSDLHICIQRLIPVMSWQYFISYSFKTHTIDFPYLRCESFKPSLNPLYIYPPIIQRYIDLNNLESDAFLSITGRSCSKPLIEALDEKAKRRIFLRTRPTESCCQLIGCLSVNIGMFSSIPGFFSSRCTTVLPAKYALRAAVWKFLMM